jgi:TonB family protein
MTWLEFLGANAGKATLILLSAFSAAAVLRRASAAMRHFIFAAALAALLMLPAAILLVPKWSVRPASPEPAPVATAHSTGQLAPTHANQAKPAPQPRMAWTLLVWAVGCLAAASRFLLGAARTSWMVRHAAEAGHAKRAAEDLRRLLGIRRPVRVLESTVAPMPLTWGILRPVVVLPEGAREWPKARLTTVLLHELVHVERLDLLAQGVAQVACCLNWFHPLAWMAARRLRRERERACDDAVLLRGVAAPDYAGHLMELVRGLAARHAPWTNAPAMAEASDLESRVRALLDGARNRRPLSRRAAVVVAVAGFALLLPVAAVTEQAQAARGSLSGMVQDASGARVPNCQVTATNGDGVNQEVTRTNAVGEFRFASIPPGHYTLEVRARGFAAPKLTVAVVAGAAAQQNVTLDIGQVNESMVITGQKPPTTTPMNTAGTPQRIRVGGNVQATKVVKMVRPSYPSELQQLGVEGTVVMRAVISTAGALLNLEVVNTDVDPRLAKAALDAVGQWVYQPTLLNGQPVEVVTTITLDFRLQ